MSCSNCTKVSDNCVEKIYTPCIFVELVYPEISSLFEENCATLDEVLEDIYDLINDLTIDFTDFELGCLVLEDITVLGLLQLHTTEICELKESIETLQSAEGILGIDITGSDLDFSCFTGNDPCGDPISITTLGDLLQTMIDKICALEGA